jgi:hypothetical protein
MTITAFRTEITDTVKALFELNKLKIVLTSGLLAVAFGIGSASKIGDFSYLVLTLVPFICLYVDYQYYHGLAKIFVLARFLAESNVCSADAKLVQNYERYVDRIRSDAAPGLFSFESKAQIGSSALLTITCPLLGVLALAATPPTSGSLAGQVMMFALALSTVAGLLLVLLSFRAFKRSLLQMKQVALPESPRTFRKGPRTMHSRSVESRRGRNSDDGSDEDA